MITTSETLSDKLQSRCAQLSPGEKFWIGLAGAPGSGKSTLARELKTHLGDSLCVLPMDGYHFYRKELDEMPDPEMAHARRGAPFTFNANRFVKDLQNARMSGVGSFPGFQHGTGDPVEGEIVLREDHRLVVVEGNYLLLDEKPWCRLRESVFDETWFLHVPIEECKARLIHRHQQESGRTETEAKHRVDTNDGPNAELVLASMKNAGRAIVIESLASGENPPRRPEYSSL